MGTVTKLVRGITGESAAEAAGQAAAVQERLGREALQQLKPFQEIELAGLRRAEELAVPAQEELRQLLGFGGAEAQQAAQQAVLESPAQQALRERAARLSTRTASAIGGLGGGNIRQELFEQGRGLDLQALQQRIGQLGGLAGQRLGAGATRQVAGGLTNIGQIQASGILGAAQARQQGISNLLRLGGAAVGGSGLLSPSILQGAQAGAGVF